MVSLNARLKFCISTFYVIIDNLKADMSRRGQLHNDIADRFSCLVDVPETSSTNERVRYSECCEELINAYPEDLDSNLFTELQQVRSYIRHKLSAIKSDNTRYSHAELNKAMVKENIECAFPNVEISLGISLIIMVTKSSAEHSFSQLKHIKNLNRTTMGHEKLDSSSLPMIEAD